MKNRLKILNIWVDPVSRNEALQTVRNYLENGSRAHSIFASNPEKNFSVPKDPGLYQSYKDADLLLPDGIGIVVAANKLYGTRLERVPGSEFIFDICKLAEDEGYKIFVYGAKETVNQRSVDILKERYPALNIAGRANGYLKDEDMAGLIERINNSGAEIMFIALGSPKQEKWFTTYKDRLSHVRVCQAIGGTLDTIGGEIKRAPEFWCRHNLEWLYRLISEPGRINRQRVLPVFALLVLKAWIGKIIFQRQAKRPPESEIESQKSCRPRISAGLKLNDKWKSVLRKRKFLIAALIIVLLVTFSPQILIVADQPIKADAVVVLLGPVMEERMQQARKLVLDGWSEYLIVPATLKGYRLDERGELVPADVSGRKTVRPKKTAGAAGQFRHMEDTHVELLRARSILEGMGLGSANFVSSPYHMRRIKMISDRVFKGWNHPMAYVTTTGDRSSAFLWWMNRSDRWWVTREYLKIAWFLIYEFFI